MFIKKIIISLIFFEIINQLEAKGRILSLYVGSVQFNGLKIFYYKIYFKRQIIYLFK